MTLQGEDIWVSFESEEGEISWLTVTIKLE